MNNFEKKDTSRRTALRALLSLLVATVMLNHPATAQVANAHPGSDQPILTDIGALPPAFPKSQATAINNRGHVVGSLIDSEEGNHAFLYRNGTMINLGVLPTGTFSDAYGVNERDQVVGRALYVTPGLPNDRFFHAFLWQNGVMTDIGMAQPELNTQARAINNRGQIVGVGGSHAFLYENGAFKDLGTLGGINSVANAINDWGAVVGNSELADGSTHGFLYWNGVMRDLGTLGGSMSDASGINNLGQIVGTSTLADGTSHGYLYMFGHMIDLTKLPGGSEITGAYDINDLGQILCPGLVYERGHAIHYSGPLPPNNVQFFFATQFSRHINNRGKIPGWILPASHAGVLDINELAESQE